VHLAFWYSSGNSFFQNNFSSKKCVGCQEPIMNHGSSVNIWDNGLEGNYWSRYNGTDSNHDGIGDAPYIIGENNTDHYPLMVQYVIPEFPTFLILPLFVIATLLTVIIYRRKHIFSTGR
jgi:hypothetical protein